jgi:carbonic anhydrase
MSIIDTALTANRNYAKRRDPKLSQRPAPKIAVVTCMDPRLSYQDPRQNTRDQINKVRSHPWIAKEIPVRGFVFDMETGLLAEVAPV